MTSGVQLLKGLHRSHISYLLPQNFWQLDENAFKKIQEFAGLIFDQVEISGKEQFEYDNHEREELVELKLVELNMKKKNFVSLLSSMIQMSEPVKQALDL